MGPSTAHNDDAVPRLQARLVRLHQVLLHSDREAYREELTALLDQHVEYVDPVHHLVGRKPVVDMLCAAVDRMGPENIDVHTVLATDNVAMWAWTLHMRILGVAVTIHGAVHAEVRDGRIVKQREMFDPLGASFAESRLLGRLYRRFLRAF